MVSAEQMKELVGKTVYFRSNYNDVNCGVVKGVSFPNADYARIDRINKPGEMLLVKAVHIFLTEEELFSDNNSRFMKQVKTSDASRRLRVGEIRRTISTTEEVAKLVKEYKAIRDAIAECSVKLLGTCIDPDNID